MERHHSKNMRDSVVIYADASRAGRLREDLARTICVCLHTVLQYRVSDRFLRLAFA